MRKTKATEWLFFADSDIETAQMALTKELYHVACFHSQQAAEKLLKALIAVVDRSVPKTHSLLELFNLAVKHESDLNDFHDLLSVLDKYYTPTRYPDALPGSAPEGLPGKQHALHALEGVGDLADLIRKKISIRSD